MNTSDILINQPYLLRNAFRNHFSKKAARVGCNLSAITYCSPDVAIPRLRSLGWHGEFITNRDVDCYVCNPIDSSAPKITVVSIRGSQKKRADWFRNFDALKKSSNRSPSKDHNGYRKGWEFIERQVVQLVRGDFLFWTGHSAGGGVSVSGMLDFVTDPALPPAGKELEYALYSYGCPPTLNNQAVQQLRLYLPNQGYRLVNNLDIVPSAGIMSQHCGQLLYLNEDKIFSPPHNPLRIAFDKVKSVGTSVLFNPFKAEAIADHEIADYALALKKTIGLQGTDLEKYELKSPLTRVGIE